jgi:hypothetical protein
MTFSLNYTLQILHIKSSLHSRTLATNFLTTLYCTVLSTLFHNGFMSLTHGFSAATTHSSSLLLQLQNSAHLWKRRAGTYHRKHMSHDGYPASPVAGWLLPTENTRHMTATLCFGDVIAPARKCVHWAIAWQRTDMSQYIHKADNSWNLFSYFKHVFKQSEVNCK